MAETTEEALRRALEMALAHVSELRDAWERGVISEHDGKGGHRSNRNVEVECVARAALALPVTPSRAEYRVAYAIAKGHEEWIGGVFWSLPAAKTCYESLGDGTYSRTIQARTAAGPWLPYQDRATDSKVFETSS